MEVLFRRQIDWQTLAENGKRLTLRMRSENDVRFQVRFLNTENDGHLPWRRVIDVELSAEAGWTTVSVLLTQMEESGAWSNSDNIWILPNERDESFDWQRVYAFQIVAEQEALTDHSIQIESILIE